MGRAGRTWRAVRVGRGGVQALAGEREREIRTESRAERMERAASRAGGHPTSPTALVTSRVLLLHAQASSRLVHEGHTLEAGGWRDKVHVEGFEKVTPPGRVAAQRSEDKSRRGPSPERRSKSVSEAGRGQPADARAGEGQQSEVDVVKLHSPRLPAGSAREVCSQRSACAMACSRKASREPNAGWRAGGLA